MQRELASLLTERANLSNLIHDLQSGHLELQRAIAAEKAKSADSLNDMKSEL